jgi:hypothetical protein
MASRKILKKNIKLVSTELVSECYVNYIFFPEIKEEKIDAIVLKITKLNYDLIARINNPDGKDNKKRTKTYYKKLIEDWNNGINGIVEEMKKLNK